MDIEIVTIGDELLLGFTIDTNAAHLGRELAAAGITVVRRTTVGDDEPAIADAIRSALARADGVITTGGLGPTADDRSKPAVAGVFGRTMELHTPTLEAIRARWAARGLGELPVTNRHQAMVPSGAQLIPNGHGSAPGIWLENAAGRWIAMLPGVPREMRGMFAGEVLPRLRRMITGAPVVIASRMLRTTGVPESRIADDIGSLELPAGVSLSYLPGWEGVDLRLTVRGASGDVAAERLANAMATIRAPIAHCVYGEDDLDLAAAVVADLDAAGETLAVGESCTGGMLGMRVTGVPGSSRVFRGGVIAYENAVKESQLGVRRDTLAAHGAVSAEVAREMADGARTRAGASIGVGITGIAGSGGAVPGKPAGTVCICVSGLGAQFETVTQYIGDRHEVRLRATQGALVLVRRLLAGRVGSAGSVGRTSGPPAS